MKRVVTVAVATLLVGTGRMSAQTSIDVLEDDLKQVKQEHDATSSQLMTTFLSTLQSASESPSMALDLYKRAGGSLPDAAPVRTHYEYETPTEKAQRDAIDAQNFASVAIVIQVHCGLMRNAALLTVTPKAPGVQERWLAWLKATAEVYPQLAGKRAFKDVSMRDSVVSNYLAFRGWGGGDPGKWAVRDMPQLYRDLVLEPLRHPPGPETTDTWDTYIAMRQADEPDKDKWAQQEEPELDFDRDSDDFAVQPSMDKLAALDAIIKANPSDDKLDEWITRMQAMIDLYRRGGGTTHAAATPLPAPSVAADTVPTAAGGSGAPSGTGLLPGQTPGTPSSGSTTTVPGATPSTPDSGARTTVPGATPSTPSSGATTKVPGATPGTPSSGTTAPVPGATPATPSSGSTAPSPAGP